MDNEKKIEIPFGAFDSELIRQEISIPNGFNAVIDGNKIILTRAESEDERIRKDIIVLIKDWWDRVNKDNISTKEQMLAWLERQGEQKPQRMISAEAKEAMYKKPADKVEPKFKVGDWVVYYRNDSSREVLQVYDIRDGRYYFTDNVHFSWSVKECDEKSHLWTIQDAKDGDVLASKDKEDILIHKSNSEIELLLTSYISFSKKEGFCPRQYSAWDSNEFIPATKKQRDLLFSKMREAGYEWDAEKKELRKIEQKPTDLPKGEDYGIDGLYNAIRILEKTLGKVDGYQTDDGILEHECAISAVKSLYEQEPTWSEEDEAHINGIIDYLLDYKLLVYKEDMNVANGVQKELDWLETLKQRIGE